MDNTLTIAITCISWGRDALFEKWCQHVQRLNENSKHNIIGVVACSEESHKKICDKYGIACTVVPNEMRNKANNSIWLAMSYDVDKLLFLGSDDFISDGLLDYYANSKAQIVELMDLHFYDEKSKKAIYWGGYKNHRKGEPLAVGRCMNKEVLERFKGRLWSVPAKHSFDQDIWFRVKSPGFKTEQVFLKDINEICVDVKTKENITSLKTIKKHLKNVDNFDAKIIAEKIPEL